MDEETFASAFNAYMTECYGKGWGGFPSHAILTNLVPFFNKRANESERLPLLDLQELKKIPMEHPDLEKAVKECRWSFVRSHLALQLQVKLPSPKRPNTKTQVWQRIAVREAWITPYKGKEVDLFLRNLNSMLDSNKPYSKQVAIIQSSGCGKSRMVHEAAKKVFTFPINLREAESGYGYPPSDPYVLSHFGLVENSVPGNLAKARSSDQRDLAVATGKTHFLWFLAAVFEAAKHELSQHSGSPFTDRAELAQWWDKKLNHDAESGFVWRQNFYNACIENAQSLPPSPDQISPAFAQEKAAATKARDALTALKVQMHNSLTVASHDEKLLDFLLYFDESHTLRKPIRNDPFQRTVHDVLESAVDKLLQHQLFIVYLSTSSSLAVLAPSAENAHSLRIVEKEVCLRPPITETPFDCGPDLPLDPTKIDYTRDKISSIEFLSNFGRPLWWTLVRAMKKTAPEEPEAEIIDLALTKLLGSNLQSDRSKLAALDVLLMFDYEPLCEEAQEVEDTLIQSHMRVMYSVLESRKYFRSGYSSEPLLAEAACLQMYKWNREAQQKDPNADVQYDILFKVITQSRLIDLGKVGELMGRDRFTKAYIRAVVKEQQNSEPRFSKGCLLTTLMREMFVKDMATRILTSLPDNVPRSRNAMDRIINPKFFQDAFKDAVVRITHFVKFADDSALSQDALLYMYLRGAAIWCREGQDAVDIIIPICMKPEQPRSEHMAAMFNQLKRKSTPVRMEIDADTLHIFPPPTEECMIPYISIVMELEMTSPPHDTPDVPTKYKPNAPKRAAGEPSSTGVPKAKKLKIRRFSFDGATVGKPGMTNHPKAVHPRYAIFAYGCSNKVYADIHDSQHRGYQRMLATRRLLKDHPRNDERSLDVVKKNKPFFAGGEAFFDWTRSQYLGKGDTGNQNIQEEGVVVGDWLLDE